MHTLFSEFVTTKLYLKAVFLLNLFQYSSRQYFKNATSTKPPSLKCILMLKYFAYTNI